LAAKGCFQIYDIDYQETFSPMVRHSTLRMLFSLAVELDMTIDHMDVITAFLNGNLKEKYIQPQHYVNDGNKECLKDGHLWFKTDVLSPGMINSILS
jgi:hypothetical protein